MPVTVIEIYNNGFRPTGPEILQARLVGFDKLRETNKQWEWEVGRNELEGTQARVSDAGAGVGKKRQR